MSVDNEARNAEDEAPTGLSDSADFLDFLNSSDTELDDSKSARPENFEANSDHESVNGDSPSLTLSITNVVVMASMRCHLRLKEIARSSVDVEYKALQNHVIMRLRSPYTVATIWSSGKIWCTGANSLAKAKTGARRIARRIAKCGFPCRFSKYRVVNIMATCHLPFRVRLEELVKEKPMQMCYEPELAPGLTFKTDLNSSTLLKVFSTGRVVIMGPSLDAISDLVEELVPLAALHQTDEPVSDSDDEEYKQNKSARVRAEAAAARRMLFLPGELPVDALGYVDDEDEYDVNDEGDGLGGYSTDDSTDSGASVDSEGVSSRTKRHDRSRTLGRPSNSTYGLQNKNPSAPPRPMSLRESMDFAFCKRAAGDVDGARGAIAAAADLRRERESQLQLLSSKPNHAKFAPRPVKALPSSTDPTWSKKTVASGSTKRACVVTYSGTEDSGDTNFDSVTSASIHPPHSTLQQSSPAVRVLPSTSISPSTTVVPAACLPQAIVTGYPPTSAPAQPQYVIVTAAQSLPQSTLVHTSPATQSTAVQLIHHSVPAAQRQVIRLAQPPVLGLSGQNGCAIPSTVYPIRVPSPAAGVQAATVLPTVGAKFVNYGPTPDSCAGPFLSLKCVSSAPTYQLVQPSPINGPVFMGTTFYQQPMQLAGGVPVTGGGMFLNPMSTAVVAMGTPVHPSLVNAPMPQSFLTNQQSHL
ncbi:hypothetical protein CRM22_000353 [Opisthorchis felineus]|uniref:TATA box-binding protein-like 1 n=1 Tax=Opisthorchis felineus TaxID=147828 RepID=A0A4S2MFP2_OPIFE|nr:hypothetical protein CRM22_000353 [Opisthorchis felineus]